MSVDLPDSGAHTQPSAPLFQPAWGLLPDLIYSRQDLTAAHAGLDLNLQVLRFLSAGIAHLCHHTWFRTILVTC